MRARATNERVCCTVPFVGGESPEEPMVATTADDPGLKSHFSGTHRTLSPTDTLSRVQPLFRRFGITRVANVTSLDRIGVPVVVVCRPNARSSAVFHGKGIDLAAAKASGVMEAIETWHAEQTELPLRFGRFAELRTRHNLIDVDALPRLPASRFQTDVKMLWAEGEDLIGCARVWLPFDIVHADGTMPVCPGSGCFASSTNGLASGNHHLEAVSHGLCEVIERDATSLWNRMRPEEQDARRIDPHTVSDLACRDVLDRFERAELDVAVWDITTDVGVAAFQCLGLDRTGTIPHVAYGAGCHPAHEIALLRALTEAAQVRTTYIVGSREDISLADYGAASLHARSSRAQRLMRPSDRMRDFGSVATRPFATFEAEVAWLLGSLRGAGIDQAVIIDLTRPEFGISVVRVVVPGLEGSDHHHGYEPGRRARALMEQR
jgi:YcaO-like protein with predicted kinase domain